MDYFRNDTQAITVGGITIENGLGRLVVHGAMTIVADETSLNQIRALKERLGEVESALSSAIESGAFPVSDDDGPELETVNNPFA